MSKLMHKIVDGTHWEEILDGRVANLCFEKIILVQEQNLGRVSVWVSGTDAKKGEQ